MSSVLRIKLGGVSPGSYQMVGFLFFYIFLDNGVQWGLVCLFISTVVMNFDTFRINICAVYLLSLSDFFVKPFNQMQEMFVDQQSTCNKQRVDQIDCRVQTATTSSESQSLLAPLTVSAKVKQCEILLFAEPTKPDSRVLLIKVSLYSSANVFSMLIFFVTSWCRWPLAAIKAS